MSKRQSGESWNEWKYEIPIETRALRNVETAEPWSLTPRIDKSTPQHHAHGLLVRPRIPLTSARSPPPIPVRVSSYLLSLQGLGSSLGSASDFFLNRSHRFNLHLELQVQFSALLFTFLPFTSFIPNKFPIILLMAPLTPPCVRPLT